MAGRIDLLVKTGLLLLMAGCATPLQGQPHPDLDTELMLQILHDIDYVVTNYAWLLALIGL